MKRPVHMMNRRLLACISTPQFWLNIVVAVVVVEMIIVLLNSIGFQLPNWIFMNFKNFSINWQDNDPSVEETVGSFLTRYKEFCEKNLLPDARNLQKFASKSKLSNTSKLCDCIPEDLVGGFFINYTAVPATMDAIASMHPELAPGGLWSPTNCIPRQRIAVIIPFRDREEHLKALLYVLHPLLQRQLLDYTIFVVEQAEPEVFNKAMLMNAGFKEATRVAAFDCYIFHDVDMLPEDDHNFYVCSSMPRHMGAFVDKWEYKIPYVGLFGGVTAFTKSQFEYVNGYSNQYYGWGGEDDDMYKRLQAKSVKITRFPRSAARYNMIKHEADARNPFNIRSSMGWLFRPAHYDKDGLSTLIYTRKSVEFHPLYYWLHISLPPPPPNFKSYNRVSRSTGVGCHSLCLVLSNCYLVSFTLLYTFCTVSI